MSRTSGRSASRLAAILDALPDALLLVDATGVVVNANAVALELFEGESAERLLGKPISVLLPGLGRGLATGPGPAALPAGSPAPPGAASQAAMRTPAERLAARRTDGTLFPAEVNTAKLPDDEDELALYVVRDLTGVLDVEAELRRQQRQMELILRAASEGIIGVDNEARIVLVNPAGARILRHRASDLGGQDVHDLIAHSAADGTPIPPEKCLLVDSLRTGVKHRSSDEVLWRSDGTSVTVDMTTAPVYEGDVIIGAVMTFEDNSESRAAQRRARDLAEVLEDELRGPLSAVLTELRNVAEYGIGELGPNVRQALGSATTELADVAGLVDDIVDYQHMVVGDTPCRPQRVALSLVVDAAVEATDEAAASLGVDLIAHTADVEVSVDPELFAKMLAHLLADMVTASPVGGKVVVTAARRGPVARIEIRGPHTGGGPLHLPIARAIAAQHGGTVTTHRIAGKGNTHVVEVPLEGSADGGKGGRAAIANAGGTRQSVRVAQILPVARTRAGSGGAGGGSGAGAGASASSTTTEYGAAGSSSAGAGAGAGNAERRQGPAGAPGQVKQVEKTNGHHTSHGADARRPVTAGAGGQAGQARIPSQARSTLSRPSGGLPLDLKPTRPMPTSDVWSRPRRTPVDPSAEDVDMTSTAEQAAVREDDLTRTGGASSNGAGAGVTAPGDQQPWQPQAETEAEVGVGAEAEVEAQAEIEAEANAPTVPIQEAPREEQAAQPRGRRRAVTSEVPTVAAGTVAEGAVARGPATPVAKEPAAGVRAEAVREAIADAPTQTMPAVVVAPPRAPAPVTRADVVRGATEPSALRPVPVGANAGTAVGVGAGAGAGEAMAEQPTPEESGSPALLLWPEPDASTLSLLTERGYESVTLDNADALPRTLAERAQERAARPCAVLVDPIAAPITRRGLRILRGAAVSAGLPILVTAGIGGGPAESPQGPDPALLLQSLTPPAVSLPRVLLIEARDDLAEAMTHSLERQGMQVLLAATDSDSISRASDGVPDVVLMDLMQIRRRRTGIVEWLRDHERLTTTPIVVYTALGTDSAQFAAGLRSGNAALYLAERSTDLEVGNRIGDLLAKVCSVNEQTR